MDRIFAKKLLALLSVPLKRENVKTVSEIIDLLGKDPLEKICFYSGFEFSFVENDESLRLLHLSFLREGVSQEDVKKFKKKRHDDVLRVFRIIGSRFDSNYDFPALSMFLEFNERVGSLPLQVGMECRKGPSFKIKVYLSCNANRFPLEIFCKDFGLDYEILKKNFRNRKFDAVAIDFMPDGAIFFKFYPLVARNAGLLCRFDGKSNMLSIKKWKRFPEGLPINNGMAHEYMQSMPHIHAFAKENACKIHYICEEKGKKSVYLR